MWGSVNDACPLEEPPPLPAEALCYGDHTKKQWAGLLWRVRLLYAAFVRAVLRVLGFPIVLGIVVWGLLQLDRVLPGLVSPQPRFGLPLVAIGIAVAAGCSGLFARLGRGTPHPFAWKTKKLVIRGPYRYVRNPMMLAVAAILLGCSLWLGSTGLLAGLAGFLPYIHLFVTRYEERDMERRFGAEYREYCRRVPRWLPKWRAQ